MALLRETRTSPGWTVLIAALAFGPHGCRDDTTDDSAPSLVELVPATIEECPSGGQTILVGLDEDRDGALSASEVDTRRPVCAGDPGPTGGRGVPGVAALIRTTIEPAGVHCADGGVRIDVGADDDDDGLLQEGEIESTAYACNGADGQDGLPTAVRTSTVVGATCEEGGVRVEFGLDVDRSGALSDDEVQSTDVVCSGDDGRVSLVRTSTEPAGPNCTVGGTRIAAGLDLDRSGTLDPGEVGSTTYVCDPVRTLIRVRPVRSSTTTCAYGGSRIESGPDLDADGALAETEVIEIAVVCAGAEGTRSLATTTAEPIGINCANGGQRIDAGVDVSGDGVLQASEVTSTTYACNGTDGVAGRGGNAVRVGAEPPGSNCPVGGARIQTGPDLNGNGALDDAEVTNTSYACDSRENSTLVRVTAAPAGADCADGGRRVDVGSDGNLNGILDAVEIDTTRFVCDTASLAVPFVITTQSLADAFAGRSYSATVEAFGGTQGAYAWSIAGGALPPGLTLGAAGTPSTTLSGIPAQAGSYTFTVRVDDFLGQSTTRTFTVRIAPPPCQPGVGGVVGVRRTDLSFPTTIATGYGMDVDTSTGGWVYITDLDDLYRVRKDASALEDLGASIGLSSGDLGYEVQVFGDDIYVVDDGASSTNGRVRRISADGGATFSVADRVNFASAPDDIRGIELDGDDLYMLTHGASDTELYVADMSSAIATTATRVATLTDIADCSGLALDRRYFYTACDDSAISPNAVVRIDRATFAVTVLIDDAPDLDTSTTYNGLELQDVNTDGVADVLWVQGFGQRVYVCDPATAAAGSTFFESFGAGSAAEYGVGLDAVNARLYQYDDVADELYVYQ